MIRSQLMQTLHDNMHVRKKSNFIIMLGKKGSGKSWLGLSFGQTLEGETFGMAHVCFSIKQLFDLLDKDAFKVGDVVILEEIGVAANARDAMTRTNKHLSFLAQAIRPARITLIANTISWGLIDNQIKNMADYRINVLGHDVIEQTTKFKFMAISPNEHGAEPMKSHLQFNGVKYTSWTMKAPGKELRELYDVERSKYIKQIYSDGLATITGTDDIRMGVGKKKERKAVNVLPELVDKCLQMKDDVILDGKLNRALVELKLGVSRQTAQDVVSGVRHRWQKLGGMPI